MYRHRALRNIVLLVALVPPSMAAHAYTLQNSVFIPLGSFQNRTIIPKLVLEENNIEKCVCVEHTGALEVQIVERTATNKKCDTQLLENQHFAIVQENG